MIDLPLTQQFAVLAVNDKGKISSLDQDAMTCLVVAGLLELEQAGCLVFADKKATTRAKLPTERDYLTPIYALIEDKEPVKIDKVISDFIMSFTGKRYEALFDGVMAALKARKLTERVESGFFSNKISFAPSAQAERMVVENLRAALLGDAAVSESTAVLAVLLDKSAKLKEYFTKDERRAMKEHLKALAQTPEGKLIAKAIENVQMLSAAFLVTVIH